MERFVAELVEDYENGKVTRRQVCETIALAAVVYAAGDTAANAAEPRGFKPLAINHISYACADYRKARDFYASVFGMEKTPSRDNGRQADLTFGPAPGKGGSFLIARNGSTTPKAKSTIDHICYTIPNWDDAKIRAALTAKGLNPTGRDGSLHIYDPFDYDVQIASAAQENAFRR